MHPGPSPQNSTVHVELRRAITFWPLLFYGLGVIVGAGIYVATDAVIQRAGDAAPISFFVAGFAAGLTGLCYAELGARFPEAGRAAAYVREGFGSDTLAIATGVLTTLAVTVAAASIAHGTAQYLSRSLGRLTGAAMWAVRCARSIAQKETA
jgi:basic amino acid/polyamine antiporter, APA family